MDAAKSRAMPRVAPVEHIAYQRLLWAVPLTALVAAIAAGVVEALASLPGAIPSTVRLPGLMGYQPLTPASAAITALVATLWAAVAFALIGRFARRPVRLFRIIALVTLILSLALPLTAPGVPMSMRASLSLLHVVVAAVDVGLLTTLGQR